MQENIRIITGTPAAAEPKANEYLASHPRARILSTAVTVAYPPDTAAPAADGKKQKPAPKPQTIVAITLGLEL